MSRVGRIALVGLMVAVVAGVAVVLVLFGGNGVEGTATTPAASTPPGSAAAAPLTGEQADELAADLISGDEARVRKAVAVSPEQPLEPGFVPSLALATIEVDASTFQLQPDGSAVVAARVDGKRWTIRLVAVEDRWLISSTEATQ